MAQKMARDKQCQKLGGSRNADLIFYFCKLGFQFGKLIGGLWSSRFYFLKKVVGGRMRLFKPERRIDRHNSLKPLTDVQTTGCPCHSNHQVEVICLR